MKPCPTPSHRVLPLGAGLCPRRGITTWSSSSQLRRTLGSGMRVSLEEGSSLPPLYTHTHTHTHSSAPAPSPVTAASVMNDSAVGPSKRTGGHETNHSCQALIFPWESHLHPPHPSLGTRLPLYPHHAHTQDNCGCT